MADNKKRLLGMLGEGPSVPRPEIQRGTPYAITPAAAREEEHLAPQLAVLSDRLQELARQYIGARRRSGEALLEAARWLNEARTLAEHGEWQVFLEATGTSDDTAERLLNIHRQAMQYPQFAEAVARNWLGQSAAALLARPSTPPAVVQEALAAERPPKVADIERALRRARQGQATEPENPQIADFAAGDAPPPNRADVGAVKHDQVFLRVLYQATELLEALAGQATPRPPGVATREALARARRALDVLDQAVASGGAGEDP